MQSMELTIRRTPAITPATSLQEAGDAMHLAKVGLLPVVDGERLLGTVSERDLAVGGCGAGCNPRGVAVTEVMNRDYAVCTVHSHLKTAVQLMRIHHQLWLVVLDKAGRLAGVVSLIDMLDPLEGLVPEESDGPIPESVWRVRGGDIGG